MLVSLRSDHKEHLSLLLEQPTQSKCLLLWYGYDHPSNFSQWLVVIDFCKLAIDFLQNGPNVKMYTSVANKLSVDKERIEHCVYGLVNLLLVACQHQLSDADFRDTVLTLNFNQEQQTVLSKFYDSKKAEITDILNKLSIKDTHYEDLQWRFEVQVSSRSLLQQVVPLVTMDLCLKTRKEGELGVEKKHVLLQTDPTNLAHITNELEKALMETRSRHSRRIQRALINN